MYFKNIIYFLFLILCSIARGQGLMVNEVSNGPSGAQEYIEMVVVGTPCTTVDIRGFIIDDNNGLDNTTCQGFGSTSASSGVAPGHIRLKYISRWAAVPVGDIILIYNSGDKNINITVADDSTDSNGDLLYVLPVSDAGLEVCTTLPNATTPNCAYSPCTYSSTSNSSWTATIAFRNAGDAAQVRYPNGTYYHGLSYGTAGNNMIGGPDNLKILNGDATNKVISFSCNNFRSFANYSSSATGSGETPGYANNTNNSEFLDYLRCPSVGNNCNFLLPVELLSFTAKAEEKIVLLDWITVSEINNDYFLIERSSDGKNFFEFGRIDGHGNSTSALHYRFRDDKPLNGISYYRLKQIDYDGKYHYSHIAYVSFAMNDIMIYNAYPDPSQETISVKIFSPSADQVIARICDLPGKIIAEYKIELDEGLNAFSANVSSLTPGLYVINFLGKDEKLIANQRLIKN
jgi:hypothetical protein